MAFSVGEIEEDDNDDDDVGEMGWRGGRDEVLFGMGEEA